MKDNRFWFWIALVIVLALGIWGAHVRDIVEVDQTPERDERTTEPADEKAPPPPPTVDLDSDGVLW